MRSSSPRREPPTSGSGIESAAARTAPGARASWAILDTSFGYIVWAGHFLVVYCGNALACARGAWAADAAAVLTLKAFYVAATAAALVLVAWHARRRGRGPAAGEFLSRLAVASDALAAAGIALQLFPILMLDLCR